MIIRSITLNNYRLYKGKNTLFFSSDDEKYNPQNEKLHRRETKRCLPENEAYP